MNIPHDPKSAYMPDTRAPLHDPSAGSFIVNLCALAEPSVPQPPPTELEGLRAFVSRRTKDGRDRFYLHVGFFQTADEAETWLSTARTTYPNAFVSKLADTLRPAAVGAPPVADTQVLKVLEAPATSAGAPLMPAPLSQPTPGQPPAKADVPKTPSAADAWNAFVASDANDSSSSGVRHLRVEFLRPRNRSLKSSKTRKR